MMLSISTFLQKQKGNIFFTKVFKALWVVSEKHKINFNVFTLIINELIYHYPTVMNIV